MHPPPPQHMLHPGATFESVPLPWTEAGPAAGLQDWTFCVSGCVYCFNKPEGTNSRGALK